MKIQLKKVFGDNEYMVEVFPSDGEIKKLKTDEVYTAEIKLERNYQFLKKFFALIKIGYDNTKLDIPQEAYRQYVIMKAGFCDIYITPKGKMILPKSISFNQMTEETFADLFSRVLDVVILDIGADKETIENQIQSFI